MNELTLDGKLYVSSKRAAELTGYAKDYVGQLCREGRIEARLVGRNWYVLKTALESHRFSGETAKASAETRQALSADWEQPHYAPETVAEVSFVNRLDESATPQVPAAVPLESGGTIEAMQDAWKDWFSSDREKMPAIDVAADEVTADAEIEPESEESPVVIHNLNKLHQSSEALNLRRIREYTAEEDEAEAPSAEDREQEQGTVSPFVRTPTYRSLKIAMAIIAAAAVGVGYIGSGFASQKFVSYKPISMIAGVTLYNR